MKLTLRFCLFLLLLIGLATCEKLEDNLLQGPTDISTQEQRFLTEIDCDGAVRLCYNAIAFDDWWQVHFWRLCNDAATDDAWVGDTIKNYDINPPRISSNPLDSNRNRQDTIAAPPYKRRIEIMQAGHYTLNTNGERLRDFYQSNYKGIFLCNNALAGLSSAKIPESTRTRLIAEVTFLRGFYYFELAKNFGSVPLVTSLVPTEYLDTMTRRALPTVYAQIRQDFTDAAAGLPRLSEQSAKDRGRATKGAALAFLAKANLYDERWSDALAVAKSVIEQGDYALEEDFGKLWDPNNTNSREFIFSIGVGLWPFNAFGNPIPVIAGTRAEKGWGYLCPTSNLEKHYLDNNDNIRRSWTIIKHQEPVIGDTVTRFNARPEVSKSARFSRKLYVTKKQRFGGTGNKLPNNMVFMRYADLLLIAAEAAYHANKIEDAIKYLEEVRLRVNLPSPAGLSGQPLLDAIYAERRSELAFEGHRLFDLRRIKINQDTRLIHQVFGSLGSFPDYNKFHNTDFYENSNKRERQDKGSAFTKGKHELWPIPQDELNRRRGLRQNPGY